MAKTYRAMCVWGCGTEITSRRKLPAGIGCGRGECVTKHNAAVVAADRAAAAARAARPRRPKPQPVMTGEWGMAVMLGQLGARKGQAK